MIHPVYRGTIQLNQALASLFDHRSVVLILLALGSITPTARAQSGDAPLNTVQVTIDAAIAATEEDAILDITLLGYEGLPLIFQSVGQGAHGVASINVDGTARYIPHLNFNGQDSFTFTANNLSSGTVLGTMVVNVTPVNDAPSATSVHIVTTKDNASQGFAPDVTDIDGSTAEGQHTFAIVTPPAHGVASVVTAGQAGEVHLFWDQVDAPNLAGYRIFYGLSAYPAGHDSNCVEELNSADTIDVSATETTGTVSDLEPGLTYCFGVKAYDEAEQESTFSNILQYQLPQVGQLVYTPEPAFSGTDSFSYRVTDSQGASVIGIAQVTVTPLHGMPVAVDDHVTTAGDVPITIDVLANDIDMDDNELTVENVTAGLHGAVTILDDGTVRYTPDPDFSGQDAFTYTMRNGSEWTATGSVMVDVTPTGVPIVEPSSVAVRASTDDGNVPANTLDSDLATRWSAEGDGQWIEYDLGSIQNIAGMAIAWYVGDQRVAFFDLVLSDDGLNWTTVFSGQSSGTTLQPEMIVFGPIQGRYVRYIGHMNTTNTWNSLTEVDIYTSTSSTN